MLFAAHWGAQNLWPSEDDPWRLYNLPHQLLASEVADLQIQAEEWLDGDVEEAAPAMAGLTDVDLNGQKLLAAPGHARNVLIIALEGIPGAYIRANREAIGSHYQEDLMPNLSRWAERGMNTPDYVLHTHQTIRGLYAMLCGDYDKLNNGTPKGVEMLTQQRAQSGLPAGATASERLQHALPARCRPAFHGQRQDHAAHRFRCDPWSGMVHQQQLSGVPVGQG